LDVFPARVFLSADAVVRQEAEKLACPVIASTESVIHLMAMSRRKIIKPCEHEAR